jgi:hypothetical protein
LRSLRWRPSAVRPNQNPALLVAAVRPSACGMTQPEMVAITGRNWSRTDGGVIPVLPSAMVRLAHVFGLRTTRQLQKLSGK